MKPLHIFRNHMAPILLLTSLFIQYSVFSQTKTAFNVSAYNAASQQSLPGAAHLSESLQNSLVNPDVSEMKQIASLIQNEVKLDSILEFENYGWKTGRLKYYFDYKDGGLKTKKCIHFGESYSDSLAITEIWTYNSLHQVEKYQKLEKLKQWHDTIITNEEINYTYWGDTVILKAAKSLTKFFYSESGYNGVTYQAGDILYRNYQERYTYNEKGQLTEYEGGEWSVSHEFYEYDKHGNLINSYNSLSYVENYNYQYTEKTIDIAHRFYVFNDKVVPFDSITDWIELEHWHFDLDQFGRDSICVNHSYDNSMSTSLFEYTPNGNLSYISISFRNEVDTTKWLEQGRLEYHYNSNNQLESFLQTFYDELWNHWSIQNSKDYYYSHVKSVEVEPEAEPKIEEASIFPNPVSENLRINGLPNKNLNYRIYDLSGRLLLMGKSDFQAINISTLNEGIYFLHFDLNSKTKVLRFNKK